ncbi:MAG: long-chain-fatty-acid--CoA ligase [Pseudomonadales bacterium]|jgi:O-succinylbenzoate-CoA ligase|nr:long-chain-fatty-acid--CoA ligase [Pseudomonadales bacterium]MDP7594140.1 long-chain-fatty-acid--CoA ligase [Pseudomonadales bacterium]HJN49445.1 long-chain-fatty-acid--CoA ligase [Pseudomonadales bacterium]|tara:strand:+ start:3264 stop:4799 length:1536 start_codon:yes stop_codon:yes gene_type:complete
MNNNIGLLLSKRAFLNPDREAYVDATHRLTFDALNRRSNCTGNALVAMGVEPGDRVALLLMNSTDFMESYFALAKIGAVVVPLNWRLVADELEFILKDSGAQTLIYGKEFVDLVAELHSRGERTEVSHWLQAGNGSSSHFALDYQQQKQGASDSEPEIRAADDDLLYIMYTSGTTGLPKGVVHSHNTALWALLTFAITSDLRDGDRYLAALPMFHVGALTPLTVNVYRGVTSVVMREFDPQRAWELIAEENITTALLVPAMLNFMIQVPDRERFAIATLRWIQSGASPLPVSLIRQYDELGIEVHQIYGLTESCGPACVINAENALKKIGSTGRAFFHTDVRVVNEAGGDCAPDEQGEVWVRSPHNMLEYWHRPEATRETLVDGWLRTGDIAVMDPDGFVYIQDRIKDMIISGGENVYPAEIENVILSHPEVAEVAVIGQPSERWGESPFALVVRKSELLNDSDILKYCDGKLARFKLPKGVAFVDEIPRNPSGKVLKRVLREQFPGPAPV